METSEEKILKENLQRSADSFKSQLESDVSESLDQLEKIIKTTAIIGGGALLGYSVYKIFFDSSGEKKKEKIKIKEESQGSSSSVLANFFRPILKSGMEVAGAYLLTIARQKLAEYIQELNEAKTVSNEYTESDQ